MNDRLIKIGNLDTNTEYRLRNAIYWPKGIAPCMTAAMGAGGICAADSVVGR